MSSRTVLVVEDEALIRVLLADELSDAGHLVVEADSADAAVELLSRGTEVEAVVTDVRMPGRLDGLGLVRWLAEHFPAVPVLVASGFVSESEAKFVGANVRAIVPKPYDPAVVAGMVDQLWAG